MCFCKSGRDNLEHQIEEDKVTEIWFNSLDKNKKKRMKKLCSDELDSKKIEF